MSIKEQTIIDFLEKSVPGLQAIYLFGSHADDTANKDSDVDLAVLTLEPLDSGDLQFDTGMQLAGLLGVPSVDLIDLKNVSIIFQDEILKTGKRIYTNDELFCDNFELTAASKAMDFRVFRADLVKDILKRGSVYGG